jgi:hypothetical protein
MYPPAQGQKTRLRSRERPYCAKPLHAQTLTITGLAKYLRTARSVCINGECKADKTLMSILWLTRMPNGGRGTRQTTFKKVNLRKVHCSATYLEIICR